MSTAFRRNRKASDEDILRLNSLGFSLTGIAERLGCHPTSILLRLQSLNVPPADTRRAFMQSIFAGIPESYQIQVAEILAETEDGKPRSIKDYVTELLVRDVEQRQAGQLSKAEPHDA